MNTPALKAPSRRRRHSHLISAAADLANQATAAAATVYTTIATDPAAAHQIDTRQLVALPALLTRLSTAAEADAQQWPADTAAEADATATTAARLRALAEAEDALSGDTDPVPPGGVPLPTPAQAPALDLADAGNSILEARTTGGQAEVIAALKELDAAGEIHPETALTEAITTTVLAAQLEAGEAAHLAAIDPSASAEHALSAAQQLITVAHLASLDY